MTWERLQWEVAKALAKLKRITQPEVRIVVVMRNERTNDQFVGGDVVGLDQPAFLRAAADRLETPKAYEDLAAIRISTGEPIKKGSA